MEMADKVRDFVEIECKKPTSKYGYDPFPFHFVPMVGYAEKLAEELGADREVVAIASWLHDIGSIVFGRENHHITGAKIAEDKLRDLGYPSEKIELVKRCILNHRGSQNNERQTLEEKIVAEADVMSNFDNLAGIFMAAYMYEGKNQGEAKVSTREKLERKWKQLHFENSKRIIEPKFRAAMLLLE
jgi:uncharacterized protein